MYLLFFQTCYLDYEMYIYVKAFTFITSCHVFIWSIIKYYDVRDVPDICNEFSFRKNSLGVHRGASR